MKSRTALILLLGTLLIAQAREVATNQPAPLSLSALREKLDAFVAQEKFRSAAWGIEVVAAGSGETLYEHNAHKLLKPASNAKLYTAALALDKLGPDFRIRTSIYSDAAPDAHGELAGDLIIYGRGDPSFSRRFNGANKEVLQSLTDAIASSRIKQVKGNLVGDETFFQGPPFGENWTWDDLQSYFGAEVTSLTVNDNYLDFTIAAAAEPDKPCVISNLPGLAAPLNFINRTTTVPKGGKRSIEIYRPLTETNVYISGTLPLTISSTESVSVPRPATWFLDLLRESLAKKGILIDGGDKTKHWPEAEQSRTNELKEIAFTESPPVAEIVLKMMKASQNLYAQLLFLQAGAQAPVSPSNFQTAMASLREMNQFLRKAGVPKGEELLDEGSGLSRGCLVTPHATVQLLKFMSEHRAAEAFRDALPVSGVDGTLKARLTDLKGKVHAKTGSLRYIDALSGYLQTEGGEPIVFSIMLNAFNGVEFSANGRDEVDAVARMIFKLSKDQVSDK
jgi:D-alanyl-D-alanine carboxypeptidase/D-alanyl-D-alanine-endopeptidase (penicillin-binding protein 4)